MSNDTKAPHPNLGRGGGLEHPYWGMLMFSRPCLFVRAIGNGWEWILQEDPYVISCPVNEPLCFNICVCPATGKE